MPSGARKGSAITTLAALALVALPQVSNASILGDRMTGTYWFPDRQTLYDYASFDPYIFTVKPGPFVTLGIGGVEFPIAYSETTTTETLTFLDTAGTSLNTSVSFNGPLLTVFSGSFFGRVVSTTGLDGDAVTDTGAALAVNFAKSNGRQISITFALSSVPLPPAAPMFGGALVAMAAVGRWARRRALTVEPVSRSPQPSA